MKNKIHMNLITSSKYQKHVACSSDYKLICVDDKFSKFSIKEDIVLT